MSDCFFRCINSTSWYVGQLGTFVIDTRLVFRSFLMKACIVFLVVEAELCKFEKWV